MSLKKIKTILSFVIIISIFSVSSKAAEECFEKVSRSVFKFNLVFDDVILEPVAKGYNKLPNTLKKGTSNFTSNIATLYLSQILYCKVTLNKLVMLQVVF